MRRQILAAEAQYAALTPQQQAVVDIAAAAVSAAQPPGDVSGPPLAAMPADIPEALPVGVANEAGLQANTVIAARAISAQFPKSPRSTASGPIRSRGIRAAWRSM